MSSFRDCLDLVLQDLGILSRLLSLAMVSHLSQQVDRKTRSLKLYSSKKDLGIVMCLLNYSKKDLGSKTFLDNDGNSMTCCLEKQLLESEHRLADLRTKVQAQIKKKKWKYMQ